MGQKVARDVHRIDQELPVLDPDVHVGAEDEQRLGQVLQVLPDPEVTLRRGDFLVHPGGKGVTPGRCHLEPLLARQVHHQPP